MKGKTVKEIFNYNKQRQYWNVLAYIVRNEEFLNRMKETDLKFNEK